jgi:hypothetical protein
LILQSVRKHWLLMILLALAAGFAAGAYTGYRSTIAIAWGKAVEYDHEFNSEALHQYESGTPREARHALAAHLRYLETIKPREDGWRLGQHPWLDSKGLAFERMLAAGRLALVEERSDGSGSSASLWETAGKYARQAAQSDSSRAGIESAIRRLDANAAKPGAR